MAYWRSFTELFRKQDFENQNKDEFREVSPEQLEGVNRRQFIGLLSASAALVTTACNNYRDEGELVPYNVQKENTPVGGDVFYATSVALNGRSQGVLTRTRDGRPLKLNGNPQHPLAGGKLSSDAQALLMSLYEPDRLRQPLRRGQASDWTAVDQALSAQWNAAASANQEIALVTGVLTSPTLAQLIADLQVKYPTVKHYSYDINHAGVALEAAASVMGQYELPYVALDKAKVILAVEADFLGADGLPESKRLFGMGRAIVEQSKQNRLYAVEGDYSPTGMNADVRVRLRVDQHSKFLAALLGEVSAKLGLSLPQGVQSTSLSALATELKLDLTKLKALAHDLIQNAKGGAVVLAGTKSPQSVQVLVAALNQALGAYGTLLLGKHAYRPLAKISSEAELKQLAQNIGAGKTGVVVMWGINPIHALPAAMGFENALKSENVFYFANIADETVQKAAWGLPLAHALESWGDHGDRVGIINLQQPMIAPLYAGRQPEDYLVSLLAGQAWSQQGYRNYLKAHWQKAVHAQSGTSMSVDEFWNLSLHDGFATYSPAPNPYAFNSGALTGLNLADSGSEWIVQLVQSPVLGSGELAHVGWLQELPHPVSKVTWDNYLAISPAMAEKLGFRLYPERTKWAYDVAKVTVGGVSIEVAVLAQPGLVDGLAVLQLGYGRSAGGAIGTSVGVNGSPLLGTGKALSPWILADAKIEKTGKLHDLAITQENNAVDVAQMSEPLIVAKHIKDAHLTRNIIREGTVEEYQGKPDFLHEEFAEPEHYFDRPHEYKGVKWAMAIDLNKCIGCGECVVSCNVENNIPVVGKEMILFGREMHWIRIDRYYSGTSSEPVASVQPMLCQHCDNAPCENVCPVVATAHSPEGLNDIAYNRCVGTRYCANTCAYKVRHYNYYNYRDHLANEHQEDPVFALLHNPEVTVRSRGVIEKCSFCVQRINLGRAEAKRKGEKWIGQGVISACQEACPTSAIAFGNVNDTKSEVRRRRDHTLTYRVLAQTGTGPNVHYQAKLRNAGEEIA